MPGGEGGAEGFPFFHDPESQLCGGKPDQHSHKDVRGVMDFQIQAGEADERGCHKRCHAPASRQQCIEHEGDGKGAGSVAGGEGKISGRRDQGDDFRKNREGPGPGHPELQDPVAGYSVQQKGQGGGPSGQAGPASAEQQQDDEDPQDPHVSKVRHEFPEYRGCLTVEVLLDQQQEPGVEGGDHLHHKNQLFSF